MGLGKRTYEARYLVFGGTFFLTFESKLSMSMSVSLSPSLSVSVSVCVYVQQDCDICVDGGELCFVHCDDLIGACSMESERKIRFQKLDFTNGQISSNCQIEPRIRPLFAKA